MQMMSMTAGLAMHLLEQGVLLLATHWDVMLRNYDSYCSAPSGHTQAAAYQQPQQYKPQQQQLQQQ